MYNYTQKTFLIAGAYFTGLWFIEPRNDNPYTRCFMFCSFIGVISQEEKETHKIISSLTLMFPLPHSLMTLAFSRQSGKSNSTTTTSEITASGETALAVLSMSANQMKHAVSCGSIKRPSTEEMGNTAGQSPKRKIYLFKPARSLNKGIL